MRRVKAKRRAKPRTGTASRARVRSRSAAAPHEGPLREHLEHLLTKEQAHVGFERAVADFPEHLRGVKIPNAPYTPWQLLEHLRIAQWDILEFCRNPRHVSPQWPQGYWPPTEAPPDDAAWERSVQAFRADLGGMIALVKSPRTDLLARIPRGDGQTVLREALLVADHNAYHIGQFILLRRLAGSWEGS